MTDTRPATTGLDTLDRLLQPFGRLVNYWYPVAWSKDVGDEPLAVKLLDTPVVLWRSRGEIVAFYDLCVHRGTPLSFGRVNEDGEIVCAYHGWHYCSTGECTWIPSRPPDRPIPPNARAIRFSVDERHGLIWVCLGEPEAGIPSFPPEFESEAFWGRGTFDETWKCNAARFIENMADTSHFAWVHPGVFGTQEKPIVNAFEITEVEGGLRYECIEPIGHMVEPDQPHIRSYELTFPFVILFRTRQPGREEREVVWYVCSPVDSRTTRFFQFLLKNYQHPMPPEERSQLVRTIQAQDRRMVEAQRPEELPLDLREELHLRGPDDVALRYRKTLRGLGVDWS
jgi:phenylpropionate dioxygenase-like ring-hydroxylating dioxygenase large terminal subunit